MVNLSSFILAHARRAPDRIALIYGPDRVSYGEFARRIVTIGGWLEARGVGDGDVVAVLMKNSPAFLELAFAVSHIGAVFLPINFRLAGDEVAYILDNAEAKILFVDDALKINACGAKAIEVVDAAAQRDASSRFAGASPAPMVCANRATCFGSCTLQGRPTGRKALSTLMKISIGNRWTT